MSTPRELPPFHTPVVEAVPRLLVPDDTLSFPEDGFSHLGILVLVWRAKRVFTGGPARLRGKGTKQRSTSVGWVLAPISFNGQTMTG